MERLIMEKGVVMKKGAIIFGIGLIVILMWPLLAMLTVPTEELTDRVTITYRGAAALRHTSETSLGSYIWIYTILFPIMHIFGFFLFRLSYKDYSSGRVKKPAYYFGWIVPVIGTVMMGIPILGEFF